MAQARPDREADVPVQRLRVRYAKRGRLRFSSHRDFQRALERAVRRAGVPIAFSGGFSPHPRISYAGAAPTGTGSEAEYLEIALVTRCDPEAVRAALDASLPDGLDVLAVVEAASGAPGLPDRLTGSVWRIELPGVSAGRAAEAARTFLAADEVEVGRMTKNGMRRFDARAAVVSCDVLPGEPDAGAGAGTGAGTGAETGDEARGTGAGGTGAAATARQADGSPSGCATMRVVVRHGTPAVRPDDVLSGLRATAGLEPPTAPGVTRVAQGPLDEETGEVGDPLVP